MRTFQRHLIVTNSTIAHFYSYSRLISMDLFRTDLAAYLPWNIASCVQGIIKFIPICISHCIQHSEMVCADKYSLLSPLSRFAETITGVIKSDNANSFFISLYGVDGPLWSVSCSMLFTYFGVVLDTSYYIFQPLKTMLNYWNNSAW